uniref:uncharacterized protein LOC122578235 n=1 Tax=Erigeron canadensis TaxID=72917 RepID=UPI001CB9560B|nr:uncharacterized protein LOC122578235 [Erigeron canadensis]
MGTEVHYKNSFPGHYSMRNGNEDSNSSSWHLFNSLSNGHYYDGFTPRTITDAYLGHGKDDLKHKMLQHEAIFKNQVTELHRLYRRQTDMMEEVKRKECHKYHIYIDTSSSSSLMPSQKPYEDANRWQNPSFPMGNSTSRPFIFGADISNSPLSCSKGNGSKDCEVVKCRPSKVRKNLFDLELPAHEYIEPEEGQQTVDNQGSEISSYKHIENGTIQKNGRKTFLDESHIKDGSKNGQHFKQSNGLADLNEPVYIQEATTPASVDFLGSSAKLAEFNHSLSESKVIGRDRFSSCLRESGSGRSNMNYTSQCFESSRLQRSDTLRHLHGKKVQPGGTEISSKFQDHSHFNQSPSLFSTGSAYPFISSSNLGNSWSSSGQSWEKSNDSLSRKLTPFQTHPSCLSSPKSHEVLRDKWQKNGNGFYNGSSSSSKDLLAHLPSVGFDYRNRGIHNDGSQKIFKGSNFVDLTDTAKVMDLNAVQTLSDDDEKSRKCDQTVPSWLLAKPVVCKNDFKKDDHVGDMPKEEDDSLLAAKNNLSGLPIFGDFCIPKNDDLVSTSASIEHRGFDINVAWEEVSASEHIDKQTDVKTDSETKSLKNHFDLNSCVTEDDDLLVEESFKSSKMRTMDIDLEAPAVSETEDEDNHKETEPKPDHSESDELAKIAAEAIVAISSQKVKAELVSNAGNEDYPLLWFVEVIDSCVKNVISPPREIDEYEMLTLQLEETKEEDYMPAPVVLDIQEPDEVCHAVTSRPRRGQARRGRPRRDFQRDILPGMASLSRHEISEDHQIFGGLMRATGHSWIGSTRKNGKKIGTRGRLKVKAVEIIPAAIAPLSPLLSPSKPSNNVEVVGLDERSLTGWGKTTRRPRRQRCAAGNSVAVQSV